MAWTSVAWPSFGLAAKITLMLAQLSIDIRTLLHPRHILIQVFLHLGFLPAIIPWQLATIQPLILITLQYLPGVQFHMPTYFKAKLDFLASLNNWKNSHLLRSQKIEVSAYEY